MRILTGIPVLCKVDRLKACLSRVNSDVLIVDNNSTQECKDYISELNCYKIVNKSNIYVNPAWNQIMKFFLDSNYTHVNILSSDFVMMQGWEKFMERYWQDDIIPTPLVIDDYIVKFHAIDPIPDYEVVECVQGTTIFLSRKQVKEVYPIPDGILIWYGDEYIFRTLRKKGYKTAVYKGYPGHHGNSQSLVTLKEGAEIIERDKMAWESIKNNV